MKTRKTVCFLCLAASAALSAQAKMQVLTLPELPTIRLTGVGADDDWLAANATLPAAASFVARADADGESGESGGQGLTAVPGESGESADGGGTPSLPSIVLCNAEQGGGAECIKHDYWLGDEIVAPTNVAASETYQYWKKSNTEGFVVDEDGRVFVTAGGVREFVWRVDDGKGAITNLGVYYSLATTSYGRPKRLFWTDAPYNSPTIDLSGTFPAFYGPADLVQGVLGPVTNYVGGISTNIQSITTNQVSGLSFNTENQALSVKGQVSGQFVLAYYESGNHSHLQHVQAVEVRRPEVIVQTGTVGNRLEPDGGGYANRDDLTGSPTLSEDEDVLGPFLYQHETDNPAAKKNGWVYAIRESSQRCWSMQVWWKERDVMNVLWPFECDQYAASWPKTPPIHVRDVDAEEQGLPIWIPDVYSPTLQKYREPTFFDVTLTDGKLAVPEAGWSLVRLDKGDDVWFLPLKSVLRTDAAYYQPDTVVPWNVGSRIVRRAMEETGLVGNLGAPFDDAIPGYIDLTRSGNAYNPVIYRERTGTAWPKGEHNLASVVYPVNAPTDGTRGEPIEVWWSTAWTRDEMETPVEIPALPQRYAPVWPAEDEVPTIVLAGCAGNEMESAWRRYGALKFTGRESVLWLDSGAFAERELGGTVMFWTRKTEADGENASTLFTLASLDDGDSDLLDKLTVSTLADGAVEMRLSRTRWLEEPHTSPSGIGYTIKTLTNETVAVTGPAACSNEWQHVAITIKEGRVALVVDGETCEPVLDLPGAFGSIESADLAGFGALFSGDRTAPGRQIAEFSAWNFALTEELIAYFAGIPLDDFGGALSMYYSFREGDLEAGEDGIVRASERILGGTAFGTGVARATFGPVLRGMFTLDDLGAEVYYENEPGATGYNPNEEHAVCAANAGATRMVVWPLRCDLNEDSSSRPAVLVEYREGDAQRMQAFYVVATNDAYRAFVAAPVEVGKKMATLPPVSALAAPWCAETWWTGGRFLYQDHTYALWPRCSGAGTLYLYYPNVSGFYYPALSVQPAVGTPVPWLACLDGGAEARARPLSGTPFPYAVSAVWPDPGKCAALKIGQTLTKAVDSLPELWNQKSVAILYPDPTEETVDETALLTDPTCWRTRSVTSAEMTSWGFAAGQGGNLTARGAKRFFRGLPPTISDRFWYDTESERLIFTGSYDETTERLGLNVLVSNEVAELKAINASSGWQNCVEAFVRESALCSPIKPNAAGWVETGHAGAAPKLRITAQAADHYALTGHALTNWVVLAFNDATNLVTDGTAVDLRVFRVEAVYAPGRVVALTDPNDLLSQKLSVVCTTDHGGRAGDYEYEWRAAAPTGGSYPTVFDDYTLKRRESGLTSILLGAAGGSLAELVNTYYVCRYRALPGTIAYATMGDRWSAWTEPPALAEGWLQRCLNSVTPYTQRMTDLYNNAAESTVSMLRQAGRAWAGDVALNQDNLTQVGLIELYQTLLNTAERMSLGLGICNAEIAKQLLLAAERLNDLYGVLGDEAYSDALNPTIGFGGTFSVSSDETTTYGAIDYSSAWSSLFCFDNQVQSLLDEELALLRGRSARSECLVGPNYNRLAWNFTKGITAGEVAYAVNYAIAGHEEGDTTASITEKEAVAAYPQGHGDAYGHYLTALTFWYRLLRNPYFVWGEPTSGEMNVNETAVSVDYTEEAKFAETALKAAKAAERTVDLTARKALRDNGGQVLAGYVDADGDNAFGAGEWAGRGGYGAFVNFLAANAQVPAAATNATATSAYADKGLLRIDRSTVTALDSLGAVVAKIQATEDRLDAGVNPLGLSENAVPFDIASSGAADGTTTHYEQIRARAGTAVENARKQLAYAEEQASRVRLLAALESGYTDALESEEEAYTQQLIALYGKPYAEDIGPAGTYPTGYEGPDLYNYMMMDLSAYGFSATDDLRIVTNVVVSTVCSNYVNHLDTYVFPYVTGAQAAQPLTYSITACGLVAKDEKFTGTRPVNGEIQVALANFLAAYAKAKSAIRKYDEQIEQAAALVDALKDYFTVSREHYNEKLAASSADTMNELTELEKELSAQKIENRLAVADTALANSIAVLAIGATADMDSFGKGAWHYGLAWAAAGAGLVADSIAIDQVNARLNEATAAAKEALRKQQAVTELDLVDARDADYLNYYETLVAALDEIRTLRAEVENAYADVQAAAAEISELTGQGNLLLEARKAARTRAVAKISQLRYNDMLFRILRNQALAKYDDCFALAQKYVYLAAKAYDYETCLLTADAKSGKNFLAGIIGSRSLGQFADGAPIIAAEGDTGLAATLAQLDANWLVLKGQLGINNPQQYESTWFSLRKELYRIKGGEEGDAAWKAELQKHYVTDFRTLPEYVRFCQPAQTSGTLAEKEPALVFEFSSTIDFAKNFFGRDLADENDHAFDSTYYATKIRKAGVWFENYNGKRNGYTGEAMLSSTPSCYLIPVGEDRMRAPGQTDGSSFGWNVIDQIIPAPYAIGASQIGSDEWYPLYASGDTGGSDGATRIRRYPSFRAYFGSGEPTAGQIDMVRLVGRSVWNTRWMLIIPAGGLSERREAALDVFINGTDSLAPVSDIKIGFATYSNSGN